MQISIRHIEIEPNRRILVTSDIHGHWRRLRRLLEQAEFSDSDMLFIVGDLIEKGPDNLATLRYVMELSRRDNVTVLIGNVDLLRMQMLENLTEETCGKFFDYLQRMRNWTGTCIFDEAAAELGILLDSPEKVLASRQALLKKLAPEFDFLRSLPAIVKITSRTSPSKGFLLVHGGLPSEDLETVKTRDIYEVLKIDSFMTSELSFDKYVVVGHWPVNIYSDQIMQFNPIIDRQHHIISMDGGCGIRPEGQLNLLIIPGADCPMDQVTYISCDDFPVYQALTPQEPSSSPINLNYLNYKIRILEEGEEFTKAEHIASGRVLNILNSLISKRSGQQTVANCTDYLLPVRAGDRLSLIEPTSQGYLVKKSGVCGWYRGELKQL